MLGKYKNLPSIFNVEEKEEGKMRTMIRPKSKVMKSLWENNRLLSRELENNNQTIKEKQRLLDSLIEQNRQAYKQYMDLIKECEELKEKYNEVLQDTYEMQFEYARKMDNLLEKK